MNSFSGVEKAIEVEFVRQVGVLQFGGRVEQQTMLWDGHTGEVRPSRAKEGSHDYRYFPEPDLPPLVLSADWIARIRKELPELPAARRARLTTEYALREYDVGVLTSSPRVAEYYEAVARESGDPKTAANWVMGEVMAELKNSGQDIDSFRVRPADLAQLLNLVRDDVVSHTAAKHIFTLMVASGDQPAQIAQHEGLVKIDDDGQLAEWLEEVIAEMPDEAERYRGGEKRLQGVLVGAVMKKSNRRADPKKVNQLLGTRLGS
jgi:aspartyl-tRNA(Asn)/glutamyl-tRNA(Gln) amidotransferase subunit B